MSPQSHTNKSHTNEMRLLLAMAVGLAAASSGVFAWQLFSPDPVSFAGLTIDRLSAILGLLVATIGATCLHFSIRYLDGERGQRRFIRWLAFTILAAYVLMSATHLLVLFVAWFLTSFGLHKLLTHYTDRPEAVPPARKKFLISRLGDVALILAIVLIWQGWGTLDLHAFLANAGNGSQGLLLAVALLVVVAALTKSAQFPFHSWLPETMETPTPVSALMHAGIINAGGVLLLRFAPLIVTVPEALLLLSVVGTLTMALGLLAMWAQVKIKRILAWSTVSQMGFMMVQCGLAAFPAAALHIVGHGFYKAYCFLRSGDVPPPLPKKRALSSVAMVILAFTGTALAIPALWAASLVTGFTPQAPGELALSAILALAIGQIWVALFSTRASLAVSAACSLLATIASAIAAFALYAVAKGVLQPVLSTAVPPAGGALVWIAAVLPVAVLVILTVVYALLPVLGRTAGGRAFHVHALNGFYFGAIADRVVAAIWPLKPARPAPGIPAPIASPDTTPARSA